MASSPVAGVFDPVGDRVVQLCSGASRAGVEAIALQQCLEGFHGCVVTGGGDAAMEPWCPGYFENRLGTAYTKLRSSIGMNDDNTVRLASSESGRSAATARSAVIRSLTACPTIRLENKSLIAQQ